MATFLFDKIIFGPVNSRRLGVSLGINLLPTSLKICSFDCIYCECGRNQIKFNENVSMPTRSEVYENLKLKLHKMAAGKKLPDVITFAGNGEPTLHPEFSEIIDDTIELRNKLAPNARIAVLSNATMLHKKKVFQSLLKIEDNIQKLDSAFKETIEIMDCPNGTFNLEKVTGQLASFEGRVIIQTMFIKGTFKGKVIDNTTKKEIKAWIELLKKIKPKGVMIYTIARDTPVETLEKVSLSELRAIAAEVEKAGFSTLVSE